MTLSPAEIDRAGGWFARRGGITVLVGRVIPGVRSLISVPAGVAGMPLTPFLVYSAVGTIVWTGLLAAAGYGLGENYSAVGRFIEPIGNGRAGPGPWRSTSTVSPPSSAAAAFGADARRE